MNPEKENKEKPAPKLETGTVEIRYGLVEKGLDVKSKDLDFNHVSAT